MITFAMIMSFSYLNCCSPYYCVSHYRMGFSTPACLAKPRPCSCRTDNYKICFTNPSQVKRRRCCSLSAVIMYLFRLIDLSDEQSLQFTEKIKLCYSK